MRKPGEPTPEERSAHESTHLPFRDCCLHCVSCRASDSGHRLTERAEDEPPMVQIDYQFASEKVNMEVSDEQVVTAGPMVTIFMAPSVEGAQSRPRSVQKVPSLTWQRSSWASSRLGVLHLELWWSRPIKRRASRRCLMRSRHDGPKHWWNDSGGIASVERMNREVAGLLRTL